MEKRLTCKTKNMKKSLILVAILFSAVTSAQQIKPVLEVVGTKVRASYYFENGTLQQQGFFKDGKLDGAWMAYDEKGTEKAMGQYLNGKKIGKWFFWNDTILTEVDYSDSRISNIKNWK